MPNISLTGKIALGIALPTAAVLIYLLLRSDNDDDDYEHCRVATSKQTIIEVKVPKDYVGAVIGRGGANIKDIMDKTGARVDFAPRNEKDTEDHRLATVRGSLEGAQKAELLIHQMIAESEKHTIRMTVRVRCLGRIIGRNGETIRRMQRTSCAKITIDSQGDESSPNNEKCITITGAMNQIEMAKALIEEKVKEDDTYRAKVSLVSANREVRKRPDIENRPDRGAERDDRRGGREDLREPRDDQREERSGTKEEAKGGPSPLKELMHDVGADRDDGAKGDCGIVRSDVVVVNEQWDNVGEQKPKKSFTEVYVSAIEDPGNFWVQIINSRFIQLDELVTMMTTFYCDLVENEEESQTLIPTSFKAGDVIAAPFEHDICWYRAKITSLEGETKLNLFYVDYGDSGTVDRGAVRVLDEAYLGLPFQAVHCHLANIKPIGDEWTSEACDDFETLTHCANWVVVMAQTVGYHSTQVDPIPCLHLVDTSGGEDIDINEEMVTRGHAVMTTAHSNSNHGDVKAVLNGPSVPTKDYTNNEANESVVQVNGISETETHDTINIENSTKADENQISTDNDLIDLTVSPTNNDDLIDLAESPTKNDDIIDLTESPMKNDHLIDLNGHVQNCDENHVENLAESLVENVPEVLPESPVKCATEVIPEAEDPAKFDDITDSYELKRYKHKTRDIVDMCGFVANGNGYDDGENSDDGDGFYMS